MPRGRTLSQGAVRPIPAAVAGIVLVLGVAMADAGRDACGSDAALAPPGMVCLGDGSMLDPGTSLVWRTAGPGEDCAAIDPFAAWRSATAAEIATLPSDELLAKDYPATWCVGDSLSRVLPPEPAPPEPE